MSIHHQIYQESPLEDHKYLQFFFFSTHLMIVWSLSLKVILYLSQKMQENENTDEISAARELKSSLV